MLTAPRIDDPTAPRSSAAVEAGLERATMRRVSLRVLPLLFVAYICAHLDRTNLGFAALQMNRDLGFSPAVYGLGAGIFFLGYGLFELPSNLILARVGARRWIPRIMITWGLIAAGMMFAHTPTSFYVLRFLLGVAEAGFFPGVVFYLTAWFPATYRAQAVSRFMLALYASAILSGWLAGPLLGLDGRLGLAGWKWLFLLEGLPSVVLGVAMLALLTDGPEKASWLPPQEREWLQQRLRREQEECSTSHGASLRGALLNPRLWQLGYIWAVFFCCANAYTFWAPQLIRNLFHWTAGRTGNAMAVISLVGAVALLLSGAHSDKVGERWLHVAAPLLAVGAAWLIVSAAISPTLSLLGLALVYTSFSCLYGPFWCLPSQFLTGDAAAGGLALVSSIGAAGAFAGPNIVGVTQQMTGNPHAGYWALALLALSGAAMTFYLRQMDAASSRSPTIRSVRVAK